MKDCSEWVTLRVTNWSAYDHTLVRRGSLMIGLDERLLRERWCRARTGQRDALFRYSDLAIQALLTLKAVFDLPSQRGEGLAGSIFRSMGVRGDTAFNSGDFLK